MTVIMSDCTVPKWNCIWRFFSCCGPATELFFAAISCGSRLREDRGSWLLPPTMYFEEHTPATPEQKWFWRQCLFPYSVTRVTDAQCRHLYCSLLLLVYFFGGRAEFTYFMIISCFPDAVERVIDCSKFFVLSLGGSTAGIVSGKVYQLFCSSFETCNFF